MSSVTKVISLCVAMLVLSFSAIYFISTKQSDLPKRVVVATESSEQKNSDNTVNDTSVSNSVESLLSKTAVMNSIEDETPVESSKTDYNEMSVEELLTQEDVNPSYATFEDRVSTVVARRHGKAVDPVQLYESSKKESAWVALSEIPDTLNLTLDQKLDGREFIKIDPLKIESLVHGDTLEITIAQLNETYTAHITDVISEDEGRNVTWLGYLEGMESPNTLTITRGKELIVGGISTPNSLFSLQAHGDTGWIVDSATLFVGGDEPILVTPEMMNELLQTPNS